MPWRDHVNPDGEVVSCRDNVIIAGCRRLFVHPLWMCIMAFDGHSRQSEAAIDCYVYGCAEAV
ncbi:hypothetical protein DUQ00_17845 [Salmonella bongori]|uniref:Uncharacterized protein n=1 Tax=Salmonella bongori TaxID=54736 RepID=A0A8F8AVD3_SALBN|nr:hypothetical protein [Salmonella bongori]ECG8260044.1 hypothetical protein [Salmonella bongori serovar 48:i:-]EIZ4351154.1 hypothetical protein [Salmonella bongori serovar 48:z81:-]ECC9598121.1 hypothetical protein [Salmonella bongori]ECG9251332.1 hypothetical protein [Salmonella bongori]